MVCELKKNSFEYCIWDGSEKAREIIGTWFSNREEYEETNIGKNGELYICFLDDSFIIIPANSYVVNKDDIFGIKIFAEDEFLKNFILSNVKPTALCCG